MKVIELLNKIANGEEVPKKIKWGEFELEWEELGYHDYKFLGTGNHLLFQGFATSVLNDEVEIIKENKKIGKYNTGLDNGSWNEESVKKGILEKNNIEDYLVRVMKEVDNVKFKVFEIIDKLNEVEK